MNIEHIQNRLNVMGPAMSAKGKRDPEATVRFRANVEPYVSLSWKKSSDRLSYDREHVTILGANLAEMLDKAEAAIAEMPTIDETHRAEFAQALAHAIELGNQHGIDVQFVNPLTEAMKRLSENAIEFKG